MKLLKPSKFKDQIWKGKCNHCEAEFECDRTEIEEFIKTPRRHGMRDGADFAWLTCTECGKVDSVFFVHHRYGKLPTPPGGKK